MTHFNIIHHIQLGLPCGLFPAGFLCANPLIISLCRHIRHMPHVSSHPHQFNHLTHNFIILQLQGYLEKHFIGIYGQTKQLFPFQWLLYVSYSDKYISFSKNYYILQQYHGISNKSQLKHYCS